MESPRSAIEIMKPPYDTVSIAGPTWNGGEVPPRGHAVIWHMGRSSDPGGDMRFLKSRPYGLPVFVILPRPADIPPFIPVISDLPELAPRAVLPYGEFGEAQYLKHLLADAPQNLGGGIVRYLTKRGLIPQDIRANVRAIFELCAETTSVTQLARRLYMSRRTLGRHFAAYSVPVPSHWLQFARLMHVAVSLQREKRSVNDLAMSRGYPDGFTLSNQMQRIFGVRPTVVRRHLGWEWLAEEWIKREVQRNGFDSTRFRDAIRPYLGGRKQEDAEA